MTWRHETLNQQEISYLVVSVPEPKELAEKQSSVLVELLPTNSFICPVTAYKKFSQLTQPDPDKPLFSDKKSFLTSAEVNSCLKTLLKDVVDYSKEQVLGHSFRAGVISGGKLHKGNSCHNFTALALARVGASKEVMMSQGRWNSEAYATYIKLGRAQRDFSAFSSFFLTHIFTRLGTQLEVSRIIRTLSKTQYGTGRLVA